MNPHLTPDERAFVHGLAHGLAEDLGLWIDPHKEAVTEFAERLAAHLVPASSAGRPSEEDVQHFARAVFKAATQARPAPVSLVSIDDANSALATSWGGAERVAALRAMVAACQHELDAAAAQGWR